MGSNEGKMLDVICGLMIVFIICFVIKFSATGQDPPPAGENETEQVTVRIALSHDDVGKETIAVDGKSMVNWQELRLTLEEISPDTVRVCTDESTVNQILGLVHELHAIPVFEVDPNITRNISGKRGVE